MNSVIQKINEEMVGSCTCRTKTPEVEYHEENCRYATLHNTLKLLDQKDSEIQHWKDQCHRIQAEYEEYWNKVVDDPDMWVKQVQILRDGMNEERNKREKAEKLTAEYKGKFMYEQAQNGVLRGEIEDMTRIIQTSDADIEEVLEERDETEGFFSIAYTTVTGNIPNWSNIFTSSDAIAEMEETVTDLLGYKDDAELYANMLKELYTKVTGKEAAWENMPYDEDFVDVIFGEYQSLQHKLKEREESIRLQGATINEQNETIRSKNETIIMLEKSIRLQDAAINEQNEMIIMLKKSVSDAGWREDAYRNTTRHIHEHRWY